MNVEFFKKGQAKRVLHLMHSNQGIVIKICRIYTQTKDDFEDLYQEILVQGYAKPWTVNPKKFWSIRRFNEN